MKRIVASVVTVLSLLGGAAVAVSVAFAQEATPTQSVDAVPDGPTTAPTETPSESPAETPAQTPAQTPSDTPSASPDATTGDRGDCHGARLSALVENGTITQAQADAIDAAIDAKMAGVDRHDAAAKAAALDAALSELVSNGTITQAQADAVKAAKASHDGHGPRGARFHRSDSAPAASTA